MPLGLITLPMELGTTPRKMVRQVQFVVLDGFSSYNAFLRRPTLFDFRVVIKIWCLKIKFPTPQGVWAVERNQSVSRECYVAELQEMKWLEKGKGSVDRPCPKTLKA